MSGVVLLGQVAERVRYLEVTCAQCDRAWELDLAAELEEFGPDKPLWHLWDDLNSSCPNRDDAGVYNRCNLRAMILPELKL